MDLDGDPRADPPVPPHVACGDRCKLGATVQLWQLKSSVVDEQVSLAVSLFTGQERFKVALADQPTAPCLD